MVTDGWVVGGGCWWLSVRSWIMVIGSFEVEGTDGGGLRYRLTDATVESRWYRVLKSLMVRIGCLSGVVITMSISK